MTAPTPVSISIQELGGRLFVDRNDLIVAVGEIARRGGSTIKVVELLASLNLKGTTHDLDVADDSTLPSPEDSSP